MTAPYVPATWAGTPSGSPQRPRERVCLWLQREDDEDVRVSLDEPDAWEVMQSLGDWLQWRYRARCQSPMSSGMPSVDGSTPLEGQGV